MRGSNCILSSSPPEEISVFEDNKKPPREGLFARGKANKSDDKISRKG